LFRVSSRLGFAAMTRRSERQQRQLQQQQQTPSGVAVVVS
jgi:hypothetical protein